MKRDLNLFRHILLVAEKLSNTTSIIPMVDFVTDDYALPEISYHITLLLDANYIDAKRLPIQNEFIFYNVHRLTNEGHDFLDSIRDDKIYKKILKRLSVVSGAFTLEIVKELGFTLLRSFLGL